MTDTIMWETPRNGWGNQCTDMRFGTVEGSPRQYLMQQTVGDGWTISTREHQNAAWTAFPLTAMDFAAAVAHRVEVLAVGPTHPDALHEAMDADPETVDALAEVIHEGDWTMAGGEWRWSRGTAEAKEASRRIARAVLSVYAKTHDLSLRQSVERTIREQWVTAPRHGADRRVTAKTDKALAWLRATTPNLVAEKAS